MMSPDQFAELTRQATSAADNAYAPYSRFYVGAAILLDSGQIVIGCNVENASYRLTNCAEQTAIARAVAQFGPTIRVHAVVIANRNGAACQPCGACRQTISEFAPPEAMIVFPGPNGVPTTATLAALFPGAFALSAQ